MSEQVIKRYEELIDAGTKLAPLGGFDFSGYNARLQNKYLEWRKACLEILEISGPIGFPYKNKILGDQNGGFFFQSSAQLILNCVRELYEKLKASPELATGPAPVNAQTVQASTPAPATETGGARVLKPPPKPAQSTPAPAAAVPIQASSVQPSAEVSNKVYVIGEQDDPLRIQLAQFLTDIGLEEISFNRQRGQMLALDSIQERKDVKYAFFIINSDDLAYAMFELGHFVGRLGKGHVCVLHMTDVSFPKNVPGITVKSIVVKLEEASLGLMKELKGLGYKISF